VRTWRFALLLACLAGALFVCLASLMRRMEADALNAADIRDQLTASGAPRPLAELAQSLRQSKLVTVEIQTSVASESESESWRGDVEATVQAPVRLLYGTDLSRMSVDHVAFSPAAGAYLVRIPVPERIATEVYGGDEDIRVRLGWLRFRSLSGEYHLGLARRDLHERTLELTLSAEDAAMVRRSTLEQVTALVRSIVGSRATVQVAFEQGAGT
jgi:hypothetical protein